MAPMPFYFDFISPYAYMAWVRARRHGLVLEPIPVVFGAILAACGQLGPAEVPAKRAFVIRDVLRTAKRHNIPFTWPAIHPFRSLDALRVAQIECVGDRQLEVIDALFAVAWGEGKDLSDLSVIEACLDGLGLNGEKLVAATKTKAMKTSLHQKTQAALTEGVFGVPTFKVDGELLWGNDRLDEAIDLSKGVGKVDEALVQRLVNLPAGVQRRRAPPPPSPEHSGDVTQRIGQIFQKANYMSALGVSLGSVTVGKVQTHLNVVDSHLQHHGFVHAGVVAAMADHTAGAAAASVAAASKTPLTAEYKINLLRPTRGPQLICVAKVLKGGNTLCVVESEVTEAGSNKLVAKAMVTLAMVNEAGLKAKR